MGVRRDHRVSRPQESWHQSWDSKDQGYPNGDAEVHSPQEDEESLDAQDDRPVGSVSESCWALIGGTSKEEAPLMRQSSTESKPRAADKNQEHRASPSKRPSRFSEKPPEPPGPNWKKYVDDGFFWYYYEGPLGKWWAQQKEGSQEIGEVEPWPDDADDEE